MAINLRKRASANKRTHDVYDVAIKTPLDHLDALSKTLKTSVYLKREDLQPVHSFKIRGAYHKMIRLTKDERARGVIAASAGNHAQGVAYSAKKLGISALIVMPITTPDIKVKAVESYGAEIKLVGNSFTESFEAMLKMVDDLGRVLIHPFDDPLVIEGQGTIGTELLEQLPTLTHVFVPIGGGGLIAGITNSIKASHPHVNIIGVQTEDTNTAGPSIAEHERLYLDKIGTFADGTAVKQLGSLTFPIIQKNVSETITVTIDEVCSAIKEIFENTRAMTEPSGALAVAGVQKYAKLHSLKGASVVALCTGSNISFERLHFVTEHAQ